MRCKNCGKLKTSHYDSVEHEYGGDWCYPVKKVEPSDEKYFMKYEKVSQNKQNTSEVEG